jgi:hypothetical protein
VRGVRRHVLRRRLVDALSTSLFLHLRTQTKATTPRCHNKTVVTISVRMSVNVAFSSVKSLPGAAVWSTTQIEIGE